MAVLLAAANGAPLRNCDEHAFAIKNLLLNPSTEIFWQNSCIVRWADQGHSRGSTPQAVVWARTGAAPIRVFGLVA